MSLGVGYIYLEFVIGQQDSNAHCTMRVEDGASLGVSLAGEW